MEMGLGDLQYNESWLCPLQISRPSQRKWGRDGNDVFRENSTHAIKYKWLKLSSSEDPTKRHQQTNTNNEVIIQTIQIHSQPPLIHPLNITLETFKMRATTTFLFIAGLVGTAMASADTIYYSDDTW